MFFLCSAIKRRFFKSQQMKPSENKVISRRVRRMIVSILMLTKVLIAHYIRPQLFCADLVTETLRDGAKTFDSDNESDVEAVFTLKEDMVMKRIMRRLGRKKKPIHPSQEVFVDSGYKNEVSAIKEEPQIVLPPGVPVETGAVQQLVEQPNSVQQFVGLHKQQGEPVQIEWLKNLIKSRVKKSSTATTLHIPESPLSKLDALMTGQTLEQVIQIFFKNGVRCVIKVLNFLVGRPLDGWEDRPFRQS